MWPTPTGVAHAPIGRDIVSADKPAPGFDVDALWERVLAAVEHTDSGCWLWTGLCQSRGYGQIYPYPGATPWLVHRVAVLIRDGRLPSGYALVVDHLCHDAATCTDPATCAHRRCVNPDHLAVVSNGANTRRRWLAGVCAAGHTLAQAANGQRYCPTCARARRLWPAAPQPATVRRAPLLPIFTERAG